MADVLSLVGQLRWHSALHHLDSSGDHRTGSFSPSQSQSQIQPHVLIERRDETLTSQHYGSYSEELQIGVNKLFGLPESWKSTAMMPFGKPAGPPGHGPKTFAPIEGERVKVFFG